MHTYEDFKRKIVFSLIIVLFFFPKNITNFVELNKCFYSKYGKKDSFYIEHFINSILKFGIVPVLMLI